MGRGRRLGRSAPWASRLRPAPSCQTLSLHQLPRVDTEETGRKRSARPPPLLSAERAAWVPQAVTKSRSRVPRWANRYLVFALHPFLPHYPPPRPVHLCPRNAVPTKS